jgi:hypothetical protein
MRRTGLLAVLGVLGVLTACGQGAAQEPGRPQALRTISADPEAEALRSQVEELESQLAECREAVEAGTSAFDEAERAVEEVKDLIGDPPHWATSDEPVGIISDWIDYYGKLVDASPNLSSARLGFDSEATDCD